MQEQTTKHAEELKVTKKRKMKAMPKQPHNVSQHGDIEHTTHTEQSSTEGQPNM